MTMSQPLRWSLRARILILVSATAAVATILALIAVFAVTRYEERRVIEESVSETGVLADQILRERTDSLVQSVRSFGAQSAVIALALSDVGASSDSATTNDVLSQSAGDTPGVDALMLTDPDGRLLGEYARPAADSLRADTRAPNARRPSFAGEAGFDTLIAAGGGGPLDAVPLPSRAERDIWSGFAVHDGRLYVAARRIIREPTHGYPRGILSAYSAVDDRLANRLAGFVHCDIAFQRGEILYGGSRPGIGVLSVEPGGFAQVRDPASGETFIAALMPLSLTGHGEPIEMQIRYPYARAVALPRRLQSALLAPFAVSLLLALGAGAAVARGVTRPLDGVVRAARRIQRGEWPEPFDSKRSDEIGLLQDVFDDMTASMRSSRDRLLGLIDTDPLTELDNHRRFQERLAQEIDRSIASGDPLSLLLIDLDRFHEYNQRWGHVAGDAALQKIAESLRELLPPLSILARYGGEEFAVLLPRDGAPAAAEIAESIRTLIRHAWEAEITVSIGYAERRATERAAGDLTLAAEMALAQAKQLGRDRVCAFDSITVSSLGDSGGPVDPAFLHRFLRDGSLSTIQALAAAVDAKDPYTRGHSQRVAEMSAGLAREVGLPPSRVDLIYTIGTLHDVGKIGVPDRVLQKPGRLDEEERRLMETHPILGEVIVAKAPQLAVTLPGIRGHHERWDGKGYPDGLAGEEIPLEARILALADTFDAMTSDRPYREGMSAEVALDEIRNKSGSQFDPQLAPAFIAMISARQSGRAERLPDSPELIAA